MANTTFANLKIGALRRADHYNANDATLLELAGGIINDVLGLIQSETKESTYWKDLDNTVTATADQEYAELSETNILDILAVYQRDSDVKLPRISRRRYIQLFPDTTSSSGKVDTAYAVEQVQNGSGENIFRLYLLPTPSATDTLRYDFLKNARFSADGTSADAEFSPLPSTFDPLPIVTGKR